ncbi:MAG: DapH/DapD/GlmU-related protein [Phycisphaerales bacterium]
MSTPRQTDRGPDHPETAGPVPLVLVGGGGHAMVVAEAALLSRYPVAGFLDDDPAAPLSAILIDLPHPFPTPAHLGGLVEFERLVDRHWIIAVGDLRTRRSILRQLASRAGVLGLSDHPAVTPSNAAPGPETAGSADSGSESKWPATGGTNPIGASLAHPRLVSTSRMPEPSPTSTTAGARSVVHPAAFISPSALVGPGVYVGPRALIHARARIGAHAIINSGAIVEHDCVVEENAHIAPGVVLGGAVHVHHDAMVGLGARVLPGVHIGAGATVGAGAVVTAPVAPGRTVVGVPAHEP